MVFAHDIAAMLGKELMGENIPVFGCAAIQEAQGGQCVFAKVFKEDYLNRLNQYQNLAIVTETYDRKLHCPYIVCDNPRLAFIRVLRKFFYIEDPHMIHETAIIGENVILGQNVEIGAYSVLSGDVTIGDNTSIGNHVTITGPVAIGKDCRIKSGAVIGEEGFGFERDENGMCIHFPQIGRIEIGNGVFLGANSTVERAALEVTKIEDGAAIDDLTQVGHNVHIGKGSSVACGAVLCGGVRLGRECQIAPNACVRQQLSVGDNSLIGLGAVVIRDVPDHAVYVGNPAKPMQKG